MPNLLYEDNLPFIENTFIKVKTKNTMYCYIPELKRANYSWAIPQSKIALKKGTYKLIYYPTIKSLHPYYIIQ